MYELCQLLHVLKETNLGQLAVHVVQGDEGPDAKRKGEDQCAHEGKDEVVVQQLAGSGSSGVSRASAARNNSCNRERPRSRVLGGWSGEQSSECHFVGINYYEKQDLR